MKDKKTEVRFDAQRTSEFLFSMNKLEASWPDEKKKMECRYNGFDFENTQKIERV